MHRWPIVAVTLLLCGIASAETRFGRPVAKLAHPKQFGFFTLDDNRFPFLEKGSLAVSCMTYLGTKRYYVEIGIVNRSDAPVNLQNGFVSFTKPGYTVLLTDTIASATDVWTSVSGATPPPPPIGPTSTDPRTATTVVNVAAAATVSNPASGWQALGEAIAARRYCNAQGRDQRFAVYLATFAHERQEMTIQPGKAGMYIFTFVQMKQKAAPFEVRVSVGPETFVFPYKE